MLQGYDLYIFIVKNSVTVIKNPTNTCLFDGLLPQELSIPYCIC